MNDAERQSNGIPAHKTPFESVRRCLLCTTLGIALMAASYSASARQFNFDIKPQPTHGALLELAETAEVQILFSPQVTRNTQSLGLQGTHSVRAALKATLDGTGLAYEFKSEDFVVVKENSKAGTSVLRKNESRREAGKERRRSVRLAQLQESANQDEQDEEDDGSDDEPLELPSQQVTGSRLAQGDPTARVLTITAEDIAKRGVSSVEDVIRTIPQIFSSINGTNNMNFGSEAIDRNLGPLAVGISTANLRGFGSANTLVLLNGNRIAGAAGQEDFFVNLRNMPAGAIERVEVNLDGGSSVYGSDAVAGVINIITRKDYSGGRVSVRNEQSSNGADQTQYSGYFGYNWESGSVSANVSRTRSEPYSSRKAGYYTKDWSSMFGGDQAYNFNFNPFDGLPHDTRSARIGFSVWGPFNLILPEGNDGRNAQPEDFRMATAADAIEVLDVDTGGATTDQSITVNIEHTFAGKVRVRGEYYRTEADTNTRLTRIGLPFIGVPASNAFNNFGQAVAVVYSPQTEIDLGLIPTPERSGTNVSDRIIGGFDVDFSEDFKLTVDWLNSNSKADNYQYTLTDLVGGPLADEQFEGRTAELLASSDPNEAINLFGDGTGQNPTIAEMFGPISTSSNGTEITRIEAYLNGRLFDLPGGEAGFVLGGESRTEELARFGGSYLSFIGRDRPSRELNAYFLEFSVPVFGRDNARTGLQSLVFTASARRDDYTVEGSFENDADRNPILSETTFANTSLGYGFKWDLAETFSIRAAFDEGFRAPTVRDLFGGSLRRFFVRAYDPLTDAFVPGSFQESGPNPALRPEYSDNLSVGFQWRPSWAQGLSIVLDYSKIDFQDRIASSFELSSLLPTEVYANLPEFFERDPATGMLLGRYFRSVNISRRESRTWDLQLSWQIDTQRFGSFTTGIYYHFVDDMFDQLAAEAPKARFLGEFAGIDKRKIQAQMEWVRDRMTINLFYQYTPGYLNNHYSSNASGEPRVPDMQVDSRYTVDLSGTYRWDNGLLVRMGGRNIFDADFPFALNGEGKPYDASRVDVRGQVWFAEFSYEF